MEADLSEAVRRAVCQSPADSDVLDAVARAREALLQAEGVSLFGLETDHPEHGTLHWIVGQPAADDEAPGYVVLAIGSRGGEGDERPLFSAAAEDLAEAFRQVISDCGLPEAA